MATGAQQLKTARLSPELSPRQKQIVYLISEAKANKEIAYELGLTDRTIREYLHTIFCKLNVHTRSELQLLVYKNNILEGNCK